MTVELHHGDSRRVLAEMSRRGRQVHSVITDPPYYLDSIVKRFGKKGAVAAKGGRDGRFTRQSGNFIGRTWDAPDEDGYKIAHDPEFWKEVFDVLLPGGFCLAFSSPMTGHWQAVAMELAGFRMHPFIGWTYHTGFPKGHSVTRMAPGATEFEGWYHGTQAMKPALEPIYVAQKPYSTRTAYENVVEHRVGAMHIEACRAGEYWPANLIVDGSDEVHAMFPGSAASFFNVAPVLHYGKASKSDRAGINHPTVKPVALLRHLIRLVTPTNGLVLDPFAGSGTTAQAALDEGMRPILIEREIDYVSGIRCRFDLPRLDDHVADRYLAALFACEA